MHCSQFRIAIAIGFLVSLQGLAMAQAKPKEPAQKPQDKQDTRVDPTSWGVVEGRVYDAVTGVPLEKAQISALSEEGFLHTGRSSGKTDELGGYKVQAILGRVSQNLDVGRALLTSGLGLLLGGANNTTMRIDVSRVAIQVTLPGYKTFEGTVIARSQNAHGFSIDMEPILLMPESEAGVSVSAAGWTAVRIESATAEPAVAHKGDLVHLYAYVRAFGKDTSRNIEIFADSPLWSGERRMKVSKDAQPNGLIRFETEYKVSGKETQLAEPVYMFINKSLLDYNRSKDATSALVQIAKEPDDEQTAAKRTEAMNLYRSGNMSAAEGILKSLATSGKASEYDMWLMANVAERLNDYESASDAWQRMAANKSKRLAESKIGYVRSEYRAGKYQEVVDTIKPIIGSSKPRDWPKKTDAASVGFLGLSYVKLNDLESAAKINEELLEWPASGLSATVIEFKNVLRLAQVEKKFAAEPNSSESLAEYGRALLDLGRVEEAVAKLKKALDTDPSQVAVQRDLIWAVLQTQKGDVQSADLETAVSNAKAKLNIGAGKQESKDFAQWNQYGILLYALAEQQRVAGLPSADDTMTAAISALREALTLGRKGARVSAGAFDFTFGYTAGREVAISGFAYPQANSSFVLLDSLKRLRKQPGNVLALLDQASALVDLGQLGLAQKVSVEILRLSPNNSEAMYISGLALARSGDYPGAKKSLESVLDLNPRHPRANLVLADILAKEGDVVASVERIAQHSKFYGQAQAGR